MLGWTGKDKPLKLGAPMTKEEREAADKPASPWIEYLSSPAHEYLASLEGYVVVDIELDALAGQLTASE